MTPTTRHADLRTTPLLLCLFAAVGAAAQDAPSPPPQVAISPPRFELQIGSEPTTESIRVANLGEEPVTVQVAASNWDLDEHNQVRVIEPTEQSLDQWMLINPLRFTVPPGRSQNVRFSIRPRVEPEPGERRAMIFLDQVLDRTSPGSGIRMRFQYGVAVYGQVGEATRRGQLHGIDLRYGAGRLVGSFDITNHGNAHVRLDGLYLVRPAVDLSRAEPADTGDGTSDTLPGVVATGQLPSLPVLPGCRRQLGFDLGLPLDPGDYVLEVQGSLSGTPVDTLIFFEVSGPPESTDGPGSTPVDSASPSETEAASGTGG